MRIHRRSTLFGAISVSVFASVLLFQNCAKFDSPSGSSSQTSASAAIDTEAYSKIMQAKCVACHGDQVDAVPPKDILNVAKMLSEGWIVPQNADGSPLFHSLFTGMPVDLPPLEMDEIEILRSWIVALPAGTSQSESELSANQGQTKDFGSVGLASTTKALITLTNTGGTIAVITNLDLSSDFIFTGGEFPGAAGDCTMVLLPASSCQFEVRLLTNTQGAKTGTLNFTYLSGATIKTAMLNLTGTVLNTALAQLAISNSPGYTFPATVPTTSKLKRFTVTNSGTKAATSLNVTFSANKPFKFSGNTYPGTGGTCTTQLAAGDNCLLEIEFAPEASSSFNRTLTLSYITEGLTRDLQLNLIGRSGYGTVESDPELFNFGSVTTGEIESKSFELKNPSPIPVTMTFEIEAPFYFLGSGTTAGTFPGVGGTCTANLAAGASCKIVLMYKPAAITTHSKDLKIRYNNGVDDVKLEVALSGKGVATPSAYLMLSGSNVPDTAVGQTLTLDLDLKNIGSGTAQSIQISQVNPPYSFKGGSYPGIGGNCTDTLAPAQTCRMVLNFRPLTVGWFYNETQIRFRDARGPQIASKSLGLLVGKAISPAAATYSITSDDGSLNFGPVEIAAIKSKSFTVSNSSTKAVPIYINVESPFGFRGGIFPGNGGTCGYSLAAGANCKIVIEFQPDRQTTYKRDLLTNAVTGTDVQAMTSVKLELEGRGVGITYGLLRLTSNAATFPNTRVGQSSTNTFTLKNIGSGPISGLQVIFEGSTFARSGGDCAGGLAAGQSCSFDVAFSPQEAQSYQSPVSVSFKTAAGLHGLRQILYGTGVSATQTLADLTIEPVKGSLNFGEVAVGEESRKILRVTNRGSVQTASGLSASGLSLPFNFTGAVYPGLRGTCGSSLPAGSACDIEISAKPTAAQTFSSELDLSYNDGAANRNVTVPLNMTGVAAANVEVLHSIYTPRLTKYYDSGGNYSGYKRAALAFQAAENKLAQRRLILRNTGSVKATGLQFVLSGSKDFSFRGGNYPGTGGTCGASLDAGTTCTVVIEFKALTYNDAAYPEIQYFPSASATNKKKIEMIAYGEIFDPGTKADIRIKPDYLQIVEAGEVVEFFVHVANVGGTSATKLKFVEPSGPFRYAGGSYPGTNGNCGTSLAAFEDCVLHLKFVAYEEGQYNVGTILNFEEGSSGNAGVGASYWQTVTVNDARTCHITSGDGGYGGDGSLEEPRNIRDSETVWLYNTDFALLGECQAQRRTCKNGVMSGNSNFRFFHCFSPQPTSGISFAGTRRSVAPGGGAIRRPVAEREVAVDAYTCNRGTNTAKLRLIQNGLKYSFYSEDFQGSEKHAICKIAAPANQASCVSEGDNYVVPHGETRIGYKIYDAEWGKTCGTGVARTCNNGVLSGDSQYAFVRCTQSFPASDGSTTCRVDGVNFTRPTIFFRRNLVDTARECLEMGELECFNGQVRGDVSLRYSSCRVKP